MLMGSLKPIPAGPAACVSKRILIADYLQQMRGLIRAYLDADPERISLTKECGWKDGDRGGLAE